MKDVKIPCHPLHTEAERRRSAELDLGLSRRLGLSRARSVATTVASTSATTSAATTTTTTAIAIGAADLCRAKRLLIQLALFRVAVSTTALPWTLSVQRFTGQRVKEVIHIV
eukprot:scaffold1554_cov401-Prasinococcus_capsulatus_cf.AAC.24